MQQQSIGPSAKRTKNENFWSEKQLAWEMFSNVFVVFVQK